MEAMVSCCAAGDMEKAPSAFCMHNSACCQLTHTMHTRPLPALPSIIRVGWMHTRDASQGITAAYSTHRGDLNIPLRVREDWRTLMRHAWSSSRPASGVQGPSSL